MAEVIFNYNGNNTKIQCDIDSIMMNIIEKFLSKIEKNKTFIIIYIMVIILIKN